MEEPRFQFRPDIQGLRGVAVLLVVLYHAGFSFPSGFVGVDAFFVISGFVITGGILVSLENERFSLRTFTARRIRRLLPLLSVMLSSCLILNVFFAPLSSTTVTARTAVAAALWNANHYLIRQTSYFAPIAEHNPFLHTWSLSVEEQFYLFFPIFLLLSWRLGRQSRQRLFAMVLSLSVVSFVLGVFIPILPGLEDLGAKAAFFSSITRAWEFGVGALLAIAASSPGKAKWKKTSLIVGTTGATGLLASSFLFDQFTPFPSFNALLPVTATAALIAAGLYRTNTVSRALSCKPLVWIGDVSYGWYLWHWPIIVYAEATFPGNLIAIVFACILSLQLAVLSKRVIEDPIRHRSSRLPTAALAAVCIGAPLLTCVVTLKLGPMLRETPHGLEIRAMQDEYAAIGCDYGNDTDFTRCEWNTSGPIRLILIGDSNARMFIPALREATSGTNVHVTVRTHSGCPFGQLTLLRRNVADERCAEWTRSLTSWLKEEPPSTVFLLTADDLYAGLVAGGLHNSPVPVADFVTSTTHKTLRGPRAGMAMCKAEYAKDLDRMAREGIRFTRFYAGSTVCAPSRSVLMTGLHTGHTPIRGNREVLPIGLAVAGMLLAVVPALALSRRPVPSWAAILLVVTPVALYLQDAHPIREAMEIAKYAEAKGFHAVWQAESRLVREATVPMDETLTRVALDLSTPVAHGVPGVASWWRLPPRRWPSAWVAWRWQRRWSMAG